MCVEGSRRGVLLYLSWLLSSFVCALLFPWISVRLPCCAWVPCQCTQLRRFKGAKSFSWVCVLLKTLAGFGLYMKLHRGGRDSVVPAFLVGKELVVRGAGGKSRVAAICGAGEAGGAGQHHRASPGHESAPAAPSRPAKSAASSRPPASLKLISVLSASFPPRQSKRLRLKGFAKGFSYWGEFRNVAYSGKAAMAPSETPSTRITPLPLKQRLARLGSAKQAWSA